MIRDFWNYQYTYVCACLVTLAMTSLLRSSLTPPCPMESARFFYMLATACPICQLLQRPTSCSRRRVKVTQHPYVPAWSERVTNMDPDLVTFCQRRGMPYTTFQNWSTILATTKDILAGKVSPSDVAKQSTA